MLDETDDAPLVEIDHLRVEFDTNDGLVVGVEDVSFHINSGETVCVVGESGSGKSISSLSIMRLVEFGGGRIAGGDLKFRRENSKVLDVSEAENSLMRQIRGNEIAMIFQEPMTSLNPLLTIGDQLVETMQTHLRLSNAQARKRAIALQRVRGQADDR